MHKHTNHLIKETSPYLLQHAHNPVDWYPWGDEALAKAKQENKPVLVSIGYAACHWCHVMERESFENEETAELMNKNFINIKIDREERPDLDHIYMDAVQAMTGSGGWPLNVFLTPDAKPFYGGTYFPPKPAYNRPSWNDTLQGVAQAFRDRRHEIDAQAENMKDHLLKSNSFGIQKINEEEIFQPGKIKEAVQNLLKNADKEWGGFGRAPKFPQTYSIQFLLRNSASPNPSQGGALGSDNNKNISELKDSKVPPCGGFRGAFSQEGFGEALLSLNKMLQGGLYDQIGGGFSRYSTDTEWLVPHFEKMLYDNALLVSVLCEAYQCTSNERYKEVIEETIEFVQRELSSPEGGFYAALDADSEGVEGKFYVWQKDEVVKQLGNDASIFCEYYDITDGGNWEHNNILWVKKPLEAFAAEKNITTVELKGVIYRGKEILLAARAERIRPLLDDKIILGWNALMNTASCKAFAATGNEKFRELAVSNMKFLVNAFAGENENEFYHTYKNNVAKYPAFLDDYAYLIEALIHLHEITTDTDWLIKAKQIAEYVMQNFKEEDTGLPAEAERRHGFFFYTSAVQKDVIIRKKEVYDGAVPSGNSIMAYNLWRLAILFDKPDWRQQALDMVASLGNAITRYPTSFANWACLLQEIIIGTNEIAVIGNNYRQLYDEILAIYLPHRVLMGAQKAINSFPLLAGKEAGDKTAIYLCRNYTCLQPVFSTTGLISLINKA